jgi:hypothetical protein
MLLALLVAARDLLLVLALSWLGVTFEPAPRKQAEPQITCGAGETVCTSLAPGFDALECMKR